MAYLGIRKKGERLPGIPGFDYKLYNKHHLYYSVSPDHKKIAANNNKNFKTIPYSNQRWHDLVKFRTEKGLWTNLNQYHKDVKEKRRKENSLNFVKAQLKMKDDEGGKVHLFRDVGVEEFLKDNGVLQEEITKMTDDQAWAKAREFVGTMSTQTKKEEGLPTP